LFVATLGEPSGAARRRVRRVAEELALARGRLFFGALLTRVRLADCRRRGRRESCGLLARVGLVDESESDSDDESLNAMRRSARERLDAATFTTGSKVEVTSQGGVCTTPGVVVHDNHHGVSVRFKTEDGDSAIVVVDPSAVEIIEYALPSVEEDQPEARPAIAEPPKDDDVVSVVTPDDAAIRSILKQSGAPAGKRRRVFDDRLNVAPLGPLPAERPLGPSAHEVWFGRPGD